MKQILAIGALTVLALLFVGQTATALTFRIADCASTPCNTQGGGVDVVVEFYPDSFGSGVVITATNNLASGAVTQLAFDLGGVEPYLEPLFTGFRATAGTITLLDWTSFCSPTMTFHCENSPFDLSLAFPSSGTSAWGPGEAFGLALSLRLAPDPRSFQNIGYAQVEGACAPADPAPCLPSGIGGSESYQLSGGPVAVPDESSIFILAAMGFAACLIAHRRCS